MALTVTPANISYGATTLPTHRLVAGEEIDAGQLVYRQASSARYFLADATDIEKSQVAGYAMNQASPGQRFSMLTQGSDIVPGFPVNIPTDGFYILDPVTPGGVAPIADAAVGTNIVPIFTPATATTVKMNITQFSASSTVLVS